MNITWQGITQVIEVGLSIGGQRLLAQSPTLPVTQPGGVVDYAQGSLQQVINFLPTLLGAVLILLVGWVIAAIAAAVTRSLLNRTNLDNRIASGVTGRQLPQIEKLISSLVFWAILLITIVAVLDTLNLRVASQPLNSFLNQVGDFLPKFVGAAILFGAAWLVATLVKLIAVRGLNALRIDERVNPPEETTSLSSSRVSLSETIGNALYWFIFLLFLAPILDTLGLRQALQPVQVLITQILSILPNILGAVLIGAIGWFVANIVRRIVTNLLMTTGVDNLGSRFGLPRSSTGTQSLSGIIGTLVYVLILIPVAIAALNTLQIQAISVPAISMLQQILNTLPAIFTAAAILIIAYFFGRFVAELVTNILTSIGFDNIFSILGLPSPTRRVVIPEPTTSPNRISTRTPSELVGIIVLVGIMLFATVAAINILNIQALTILVTGIVIILGRILAGLVVFAIGLFLANLAFNLITSSGDRQARVLGQIARIAIICLVSAMALQQIGVATDIVNLAFGLLLGAFAIAVALSFGLGSRDIAAEQVRHWLNSFKSRN